jgi:hypothetical protein
MQRDFRNIQSISGIAQDFPGFAAYRKPSLASA